MPPENDDLEPDPVNDPPEPPELPSFYEVLERAVSVLRGAGKSDAVSEIEYGVNAVSDLNSETGKRLLHEIRTTRGYGSQVADQLQRHVTAEQERLAELQRQSEAEDREVRKAALAAEREEAARLEAQKQRDAELKAEIDREAAEAEAMRLAGGKPTGPDLEEVVSKRIAGILSEVDDLRTIPFGPQRDAKYEALQLATGPAKALADVMSDPKVLAAEKVDRWDQTDAETRALASQMYGVAGVFDVDPGSPEYQEQLEAAKRKRLEDEAFINEQTPAGRS